MSKDKKNRDTKLIESNLQIRTPYIVKIKDGCDFTGVLVTKCESIKENDIMMSYGFYLGGRFYIQLREDEIQEINEIVTYGYDSEECEKFFQEFEKEHNVKCFNNDGELLKNTVILGNILFDDENSWDDLTAEQKEELVSHLAFNDVGVTEIINAYSIYKNENDAIHNRHKKIMDAMGELLENYKKVMERLPSFGYVYEVIFDMIGVKKFIKKICSQ